MHYDSPVARWLLVFVVVAMACSPALAEQPEDFAPRLKEVLRRVSPEHPDEVVIADWTARVEAELAAADATAEQYADVVEGIRGLNGYVGPSQALHPLRLEFQRKFMMYRVREYLELGPVDEAERDRARAQAREVVDLVIAELPRILPEVELDAEEAEELRRAAYAGIDRERRPFFRGLARPLSDEGQAAFLTYTEFSLHTSRWYIHEDDNMERLTHWFRYLWLESELAPAMSAPTLEMPTDVRESQQRLSRNREVVLEYERAWWRYLDVERVRGVLLERGHSLEEVQRMEPSIPRPTRLRSVD